MTGLAPHLSADRPLSKCIHEGKVWCADCGWRRPGLALNGDEIKRLERLLLSYLGTNSRAEATRLFDRFIAERAALLAEIQRLRAALKEIDYGIPTPRVFARKVLAGEWQIP